MKRKFEKLKFILKIKTLSFVYLALLGNFTWAQETSNKPDTDSLTIVAYEVEGESIWTHIQLDEVELLPKLKFSNRTDRKQYLILKRKTHKVYPYAKLAAERLLVLNNRLKKIKKKRYRKKYTKRVQKFMEKEFTNELKKLTRTEGQILVKLLYRQTEKTAFGLVKELRNGWRAFWFNNTAKLFDISLKKKYNPIEVKEDFYIEDILQRAFQNETLKAQSSAIDIDYFKAAAKWGIIKPESTKDYLKKKPTIGIKNK